MTAKRETPRLFDEVHETSSGPAVMLKNFLARFNLRQNVEEGRQEKEGFFALATLALKTFLDEFTKGGDQEASGDSSTPSPSESQSDHVNKDPTVPSTVFRPSDTPDHDAPEKAIAPSSSRENQGEGPTESPTTPFMPDSILSEWKEKYGNDEHLNTFYDYEPGQAPSPSDRVLFKSIEKPSDIVFIGASGMDGFRRTMKGYRAQPDERSGYIGKGGRTSKHIYEHFFNTEEGQAKLRGAKLAILQGYGNDLYMEPEQTIMYLRRMIEKCNEMGIPCVITLRPPYGRNLQRDKLANHIHKIRKLIIANFANDPRVKIVDLYTPFADEKTGRMKQGEGWDGGGDGIHLYSAYDDELREISAQIGKENPEAKFDDLILNRRGRKRAKSQERTWKRRNKRFERQS